MNFSYEVLKFAGHNLCWKKIKSWRKIFKSCTTFIHLNYSILSSNISTTEEWKKLDNTKQEIQHTHAFAKNYFAFAENYFAFAKKEFAFAYFNFVFSHSGTSWRKFIVTISVSIRMKGMKEIFKFVFNLIIE